MERKQLFCGLAFLVIAGVAIGVGVGLYVKHKSDSNSSSGFVLPYITPPVKAAMPPSLKYGITTMGDNNFETLTSSLTSDIVYSRFFDPTGGPTDLFGILQQVDGRLQGVNERIGQFASCMSSTPIAYDIGTTFAPAPTFYVQCGENWGAGPPGFDQWGQVGDTTYLLVRSPAGVLAAQVVGSNISAVGGLNDTKSVTVWYSVGVQNNGGSHAVCMVYAEPATPVFEMTCAGVNIGFCGVSIKSDDVAFNVTGSQDSNPCGPIQSICISAASLSVPANCTASEDNFHLSPLGILEFVDHSQGPSSYPGGTLNTVLLNSTGSDATNFGPTSLSV